MRQGKKIVAHCLKVTNVGFVLPAAAVLALILQIIYPVVASQPVFAQTTIDSDGDVSGQLIISSERIKVVDDNNNVTITWGTNHPATSRVVYDTVSHPYIDSPSMYGYSLTTAEDSTLTSSHYMTISGLTPGMPYYFRPVSQGNPEIVGTELVYVPPVAITGTPSVLGATDTNLPRSGGMPSALFLTWLAPLLRRRKKVVGN